MVSLEWMETWDALSKPESHRTVLHWLKLLLILYNIYAEVTLGIFNISS